MTTSEDLSVVPKEGHFAFNLRKTAWFYFLKRHVRFLLICFFLGLAMSINNALLPVYAIAACLVMAIGLQLHQKRLSLWTKATVTVVLLVCLCLLWLGFLAEPASAQFFGTAEEFFKNTLAADASNDTNLESAVALVFNVLRAIYLLYIAVALIGVVNSVRKDEDWQAVARTPLLVVVAVTIADVLTSFVIGGSQAPS